MLAAVGRSYLITDPLREMFTRIMEYIPVILAAVIILVIGWMVAKAIRLILEKGLKAVHFDRLADKAGITKALKDGDFNISASEIISGLVYWLVMILVLVMTADALGLPQASILLAGLFGYIPMVISAVLVLVVAIFVAGFVSGIVRMAATNANLPNPQLLSGICRWAIIIFAITIALSQLGIAPLLVSSAFNIILGGIVLALAIAFGLGGKDAAARYLEELRHKRNQQ